MRPYEVLVVVVCFIYESESGYGTELNHNRVNFPEDNSQSDVQAPAYSSPHLNNAYPRGYGTNYKPRNYNPGVKTSGVKTAGVKTAGVKTSGVKTSGTRHKNATYQDFRWTAHQPYAPICEPDCENNGICIATGQCSCPDTFYGYRCQYKKIPCMNYPPLPMNSMRKCSSEFCTVKCSENHQFPDGTTLANLHCVDGQWKPTRLDWFAIPDCNPVCDPPCVNGGMCLSLNTCQCPQANKGPQCQYASSSCDVTHLGFNGGYQCYGDAETYSCQLNCPVHSRFSLPPAPSYICPYSTGRFEPQPIPSCIFDEIVIITPGGYHNSSHTQYETETDIKNSASSSHTSDHQIVDSVPSKTPVPGVCVTWNGAHYKTFDGKVFSFQSSCRHVLVRDSLDHAFTVAVKHGRCRGKPHCSSELSIFLEDKEYTLLKGDDGGVVFQSTKRSLPIPTTLPGIRVSMPGNTVIISLDSVGAVIKWDTNKLVVIESSVSLWNRTEGLCGNLDGYEDNDFLTKTKRVPKNTASLANSWELNRIGDVCDGSTSDVSACSYQLPSVVQEAKIFCSKIFFKDKFEKCKKVMDRSLVQEACIWDYCSGTADLSPEDYACKTLGVFARECLNAGVEEMKIWRDQDTCPMNCTGGMIYKACGSDSQPSCAFPTTSVTSEGSNCVEGCFCPEDMLLEAGVCLPKKQCPCRLRNRSFKPGSVIPKDCNTCTCEAGKWSCTQVTCGARCSAIGDPHYTTFDGHRYDFMGHCTYHLLKTDNLTIDVENVACSGAISEAMNLGPYLGGGSPSCTKAVTISYGKAIIHLKQGGLVLINGHEVSLLPVLVDKIVIRAVSSLFLIVELPDDVDLWWDGNTRVYVDVPPEYQSRTQGLCGTFTRNQKDDFLTPEGDIEQSALAFANKWKTREFCDNIEVKEPEHPCKAHMENKETAERLCNKLKSKLFEDCRWFVDVEPFYQDCLYDVCACQGDVENCLCPILGAYAMECAKSGVQIQWRYNVLECEVKCTGGQTYQVCADSCERTCSDIASARSSLRSKPCQPHCVEGCACTPGHVLDASNECVPVGLCPCHHKGLEFNPGYKEVRAGKRERELCTCSGAKWDCRPATAVEIEKYPPAEDMKLNCNAASHQEFTTCEIAEPLTCKNMHAPPSSTTAECRPGCHCKKGYVLEVFSKKCLLPTECPCHHGGRSYPDGHLMQEECNTCECKRGNWSCTERSCLGVCSAWGDSHFTTFDGNMFDFEGVCSYLMAKGIMERGKDGFVVEIQNVACGTTGATCSKSLALKVGYGEGEETVTLTKHSPLPDTSKLSRVKLREAGAFIFLDVSSLGLTLQWDRATRVYVKVAPMWKGRIKGLCGNYNDDIRDDFQTPSGGGMAESSALIFADSWKLKESCPKAELVKDHCKQRTERQPFAVSVCGVLKRPPFSSCHTEVPPSEHIERCERDACACDTGDDCECTCVAIAAYAQMCSARGVHIKWRSNELCPMQCDECTTYEPCISACPLETCDNTLDYERIKISCAGDTCVEGCKPKKNCPEGSVYSNASLTECVPRASCRPLCMTLPGGRIVLEGEVVNEDPCHTCRCSQKQLICKGQPCSTEGIIASTKLIPPESLVTEAPHDEPLKCKTGWTEWINRNKPDKTFQVSTEVEPLPQAKHFRIGSPMCKANHMTQIECRTVDGHVSPKETGLNVECSLEKGLICKNPDPKGCPDFEIRVFCQCEEDVSPCVDVQRPNYQHPTDCHKFYQCLPNLADPKHPFPPVLKTCGASMMYNPVTMTCDWDYTVKPMRPECGDTTEPRLLTTTMVKITTPAKATSRICPVGQVFRDCQYPCDKLCHHFKKIAQERGECRGGKNCVPGCIDERMANVICEQGSLWRDANTCVPVKDCTCYANDGSIVKPGGVKIEEICLACQCLDNNYHCDNSECVETPREGGRLTTKADYIFSLPSTNAPPTTMAYTTTPITTTPSTTTSTQAPITTPPSTTLTQAPITSPPSTTTTTPAPIILPTSTVLPTTFNPLTTPILIVPSTASPPPKCSEESYQNLLWEEEGLPSSAFTASSSSSELYEPQFAVLNAHPLDISGASWEPAVSDINQYLQVEFPRRQPIYGVIMQGSPRLDQYVTSYEVLYGDDGQVFSAVVGPDGNSKPFRGPIDHDVAVKQMLDVPFEAKFVRIRPLTWHNSISVRFELVGCKEPSSSSTPATTLTTTELPQCTEPMGLDSGLPLESLEVSSESEAIKYLGLSNVRGWRPLFSTPGEWILFDFEDLRNVTGIRTKGGPKGWVTGYSVMYSTNKQDWNPVTDTNGLSIVYPANYDSDSVVTNNFKLPIHLRYLKVLPQKWHRHIEMRIEPIGCFLPYSTTEPISLETESITMIPVESSTTADSSSAETITEEEFSSSVGSDLECELCAGAMLQGGVCSCKPPTRFFDGDDCTTSAQCPCFVLHMPYPVGATFSGTNCDECVCKLGGVTDCKQKECKCPEDHAPKMSTSCECSCERCPEGSKLCPTSRVCVPLSKWCDGVQDCPDDEKDCTTTSTSTTTHETTTQTTTLAPMTTLAPTTTTQAPAKKECPKKECPVGYHVNVIRPSRYSKLGDKSDQDQPLPPPRPRKSYQRYYKGAKGGATKTYSAKTKTRYTPPSRTSSQAFTLDKPPPLPQMQQDAIKEQECQKFRCVSDRGIPPLPGHTTVAPAVCSAPKCPPRYTLKLDTVDNTYEKCPMYVCVPPPVREAFCNVTGRSFATFDGTGFTYDVCNHILARETQFDKWIIYVRKICTLTTGCARELLIRQDSDEIRVFQTLELEYNNYRYSIEQTSMICFQRNSFDVSQLGEGILIKSRRYNFTVLYNKNGDIKIGVSKLHLGVVDGLCGTFDEDASNDRRLPNGKQVVSTEEFGDSWAKPGLSAEACHTRAKSVEKQRKAWELCNVVHKEPFSECGKVMDLNKWRTICLEKICECEDLVVNGTTRTPEECSCDVLQTFVAECMAADRAIELNNWRLKQNCPAECPAPLVHYDCYRKSCEPACSTIGSVTRECPAENGQCFPGCFCPEGKLRKDADCVTPSECRDCICNGVGTPAKFMTFERDDLPFGGNCTYTAARDRNSTGQHKFEVLVTNGPCKHNPKLVCAEIVHVIFGQHVLHVQKNHEIEKLGVIVDGESVFKYPVKNDWLELKLVAGQDVELLIPDVQLEITVLYKSNDLTIRLPSHLYANRTEGLCGVCAGYQEDLVMQNGNTTDDVQQYGLSWTVPNTTLETLGIKEQDKMCSDEPKEECLPPPPDQDPCFKVMDTEKFGACHPFVEPVTYLSNCQQEFCSGGNKTDICSVLERYTAECKRAGLCLDWRTKDLCPHACEGDLVYRPCVGCVLTCDNYQELTNDPKKCGQPEKEGCFCPEGKVLVNNTCIEQTKCFPCDLDNNHYAGDEWQNDACTKCSCQKLDEGSSAHVTCTTQTCTIPVCADKENLVKQPTKPTQCCQEYVCVPKPEGPHCEDPHKITCGFGQVLKLKTTPKGCKEFSCECKPRSECEPLSSGDEVHAAEPGMERVVDDSGCCPKADMVCKPETCPLPPKCPQFQESKIVNAPGRCCPRFECQPPQDKCIVNLEWESAPKGGQKRRDTPETVLKDLESAWMDGPCRTCTCVQGSSGPGAHCTATQCPALGTSDDFVLEPRPVPFTCCPETEYVACRYRDTVYKVGENWTSPDDACVSYECVGTEDEKLKKVTTKAECENNCQLGWKYVEPLVGSKVCCGHCEPVACLVDGALHNITDTWASPDNCTHYTCTNNNETLHVESAEVSCPTVSDALREKFVIREEATPGHCCKSVEAVECKVGNHTYQEGKTWRTEDPCKNTTCARDADGQLAHVERVETCVQQCEPGWAYQPATDPAHCCGRCAQVACVTEDGLKPPGSKWTSPDNCTTFMCEGLGDSLMVSLNKETCPNVDHCEPEELYTEGCCQRCNETARSQSTCTPQPLSRNETVGMLQIKLGPHGLCTNKVALPGFKECRGTCESGTLYNDDTGSHDSKCECCQATKYAALVIRLDCADGSTQIHKVATPQHCACQRCGGPSLSNMLPTKGYRHIKTSNYRQTTYLPEIDKRSV